MNSNAKKEIQPAYFSLYISFSFIIMIVSGVFLHIAPVEGLLANLNKNNIIAQQDKIVQDSAEMTLKNIADEYDMKPIDIMKIINPDKTGK